ncbi:MAG: hypothetical protein LBG89_03020 [Rickettsiales bacterium]|jgi:hypothetical protein|nr:hypothetical protein [Rickettsiales bacterium]
MNIFLIVLVFLFMAGYYYLGAPSMRTDVQTSEEVLDKSDAFAAVSCVVALHAAALESARAEDDGAKNYAMAESPCIDKYKVSSSVVCLKDGEVSRSCRVDSRNPEQIQRFVITKSPWAGADSSGRIMDAVRRKYKGAPGLGIVMNAEFEGDGGEAASKTAILSANSRPVWLSDALVRAASLKSGDLAYMTQFTAEELRSEQIRREAATLSCAPGEVKVFRYRTWRCEQPTQVKLCQGDMIFDAEVGDCVANASARPICGGLETAVLMDGVWTCRPPSEAKECPKGKVASYDYEKLEWVCIGNPFMAASEEVGKCPPPAKGKSPYGGGVMRTASQCGDCETEMQDPATCALVCVPDASRLAFKGCYPNAAECSGGDYKAFYFGFPNDPSYNLAALNNVAGLAAVGISLDAGHSMNRKFNCLDCSPFKVDTNGAFHPFVASCRYSGTHSSVCGANAVFVPSGAGNKGECVSLEEKPGLVPPCPAGYARAARSAACSPAWCAGDNGAAGIYCGALRQLMVLDPSGCAYCINPREGQIPLVADMNIDIRKNAGNNGWNGGLKIGWSGDYGFEIPVVPEDLPGFDYFGGRKVASENIFEDGRVIDLLDAIKWGDKTGMPVPMPVPVPQNMLDCAMSGARCAPDQTAE